MKVGLSVGCVFYDRGTLSVLTRFSPATTGCWSYQPMSIFGLCLCTITSNGHHHLQSVLPTVGTRVH